ncbi:MAG: TonB-dependent receptor [Pseudomonadota bacterium]|nr:TonB-dependent receptor [Pseudomonadota bacterium]
MIKPLSVAISSILLVSVLAGNSYAQDTDSGNQDTGKQDNKTKNKKAIDLGQVIVTGTRTPKAIDEIPGAITVVSKAEIAHTLLVTEDATAVLARTVPGYAESSQAMSNTGETLRGRIPLRLFDGIPQGSPLREGTRNGTFTDMGIIGRIEVINGPSASEGIGAAGGIINYISKTPTEEGNETTFTTRYQTQAHGGSEGWKTGLLFTHKKGAFDLLASASYIDRGISYDGDGRRIGLNTSGSLADSTSKNLFLKGGFTFGDGATQRLQATYSRFKIAGKGNYIQVLGCRGPTDNPPCAVPVTNTSEKGHIFGSKDAFNDFKQYSLEYSHSNFFGGSLDINVYKADQAMRYLPELDPAKQDPLFAPLGTLYEQSEIDSHKKGIRTSWTRSDLFNVDGLELHTGIDFVKDQAQQRLALTNRLWVPPMNYRSTAPYAQLSWDIGPLTVSGGYRREDDKLTVNSYTSTYYNHRVSVQGGSVKYTENLKNLGAIWRIGDEWSVYASYSEGFTLPNIGIPLRNINTPGQSVDRISGLAAIIFKNNEFGFNWRGDRASFGATHYISKSPFGASLAINPVTNDFILSRAPVRIEGTEVTGEWRFTDTWKVTGLYSHIIGKTAFWSADAAGKYAAGGLNKPLGVLDINPDKLAGALTWNFLPNADATLGFTSLFGRHISGSDVRAFDGKPYSYSETTHGYTLWDLGVNYDLQRYGKISLGVENLLNRQYVLSWSQLAGYQNYWAGRGRMVSVTYQIKF